MRRAEDERPRLNEGLKRRPMRAGNGAASRSDLVLTLQHGTIVARGIGASDDDPGPGPRSGSPASRQRTCSLLHAYDAETRLP